VLLSKWRLGFNPNRGAKAKDLRKNIAHVTKRQFLETQQENDTHVREERHQSEIRALYEQLSAQQQ
jgi:hypothetical protein